MCLPDWGKSINRAALTMKLSNFYNKDASEEWFTKRNGKRPCVHETLIERGFEVVGKEALHEYCAEPELPFSMMSFSWGGVAPSPQMGLKNTYLAKDASELSGVIHNSMNLSELMSKWMGLLPGTKKMPYQPESRRLFGDDL